MAITITINGTEAACEPGEYILAVAIRNGVEVPALCRHEGLPEQGCCRLCLVEAETGGKKELVAACLYPAADGCRIVTESDAIDRHRRMILSLLRAQAPESAEIAGLCEKYGAREVGRFVKGSGEKCVLCGLCVKACESLGTGAITTAHRGINKAVATPYGEPSVVCVGCASCAAVCPTGAIGVSESGGERMIWNKAFPLKYCRQCGEVIGTYMELWRAAKRIGAETPEICGTCRKKEITGNMAAAYGK